MRKRSPTERTSAFTTFVVSLQSRVRSSAIGRKNSTVSPTADTALVAARKLGPSPDARREASPGSPAARAPMRRSSSHARSWSLTVSSQLLCSIVSRSPLPCSLGTLEPEAATPPGAVRTEPVTEAEADAAIPMSLAGIVAPASGLAL